MPAAIKLTDAKCRALRKRYDQGTPLEEMVKTFGFSRIVLTKGIKRAGGKMRPKGRPFKNGDPPRKRCRPGDRTPRGFPLQSHETLPKKDVNMPKRVILSNKTAAKHTAIFFGGVGATIGLLCWEPWIGAPLLVAAMVYCVFINIKYRNTPHG